MTIATAILFCCLIDSSSHLSKGCRTGSRDRDCVAWLSKVFTYCSSGLKGSVNEALRKIDRMQAEID